jgi:hypothetical protein
VRVLFQTRQTNESEQHMRHAILASVPIPTDAAAEIRQRATTSKILCDSLSNVQAPVDYLDVLTIVGQIEHELELIKSVARHGIRTG